MGDTAKSIMNGMASMFSGDETPSGSCPHCGKHPDEAPAPDQDQESEPMSKKINKFLGVGDPKAAF